MTTPDHGISEHRHATRTDVAKLAGVSTAVVSYVVNDGPRPVADATRERVVNAMNELGYRPNALARALKLRRAHAIGVVVPDVSNTFFGALAREVSDQAFTAGYALMLGDANNDLERERAQIESLVSHQIDGLIITSLEPDSIADVRGTRTVYLDRRVQPGQISILVDDIGGAALAVRHLVEHGRTRIGHIGGLPTLPGADARLEGWRSACEAAGLRADGLLVRTDFTRAGGLSAGRELLARPNRPDAVFVASDVQALGLLAAAREAHVRVPEDLAVISFDGTDDAVFSDPPLTAIEQPIAALASAALAAVLTPDEPVATIIPVTLVIRDSCGCHLRTPSDGEPQGSGPA